MLDSSSEPTTAPSGGPRRPRALIVGATTCPALKLALAECERLLSVSREPRFSNARLRLSTGESFDATLLLTDRPHAWPAETAAALRDFDGAGEVITLAGPWFEGRLRFQDAASDPSVVYWHRLAAWIEASFAISAPPATRTKPRTIIVSSRDRDAAAAIADLLALEQASVVWRPRGGRAPFVSRADAGVWVGGQLDGPAAAELARFCAELRPHGGRVVALLDFPRHDEVLAAEAIGASAVLAKPWSSDALLKAILHGSSSLGLGRLSPATQHSRFRNAA